MKVRFIGYTDIGRNLIQGRVYDADALCGPMIAVIDESGESYYYPNNQHIFEVVDPLPIPEIDPYDPMTLEEAKQKHPEYFLARD